MDMKNNEVAATILEQLGGNKFRVMTGSDMFIAGNDEGAPFLRMHLKRNQTKANRLQITYNSMDLYDVHFFRFWIDQKTYELHNDTVKYLPNIYGEDLQRIFTEVTGLNTRL